MKKFNNKQEVLEEIRLTKYRIHKSNSYMVKNDLCKYLKKLNKLLKKLDLLV